MQPHQRIMMVPGTFAAWNASRPSTSGPNGALPSEEDQDAIIDKLEEYWQLAISDPRVIGINCYHWWTLCDPVCNANGSPNTAVCGKSIGCVADFQKTFYGADRMPRVIQKLQQISALIRKNATGSAHETRKPAPVVKTDDDDDKEQEPAPIAWPITSTVFLAGERGDSICVRMYYETTATSIFGTEMRRPMLCASRRPLSHAKGGRSAASSRGRSGHRSPALSTAGTMIVCIHFTHIHTHRDRPTHCVCHTHTHTHAHAHAHA